MLHKTWKCRKNVEYVVKIAYFYVKSHEISSNLIKVCLMLKKIAEGWWKINKML